MRCPVCETPATPRPDNPHAPFCSRRCRLVDLGKWFEGAYAIPASDPMAWGDGDGDAPDAPEREH